MIDQPLIDAAEWVINVSFWAAILFPAITALIWPWWRDWWGQAMVAFDLAIAGTVFPDVLAFDWGVRGTVLVWLQVVFLSFSPLILLWRTAMIYRVQRRGGM